ncbi:MAG: LacI family DNA-binding transcriptional regulator [Paracoccaceae bacterium]
MSGGSTLKDLADQLGLSTATVSRALSGHPRISEETRERVAAAARDAAYVPNRAAQSLASGRATGFVGLVTCDPGYGREASYLGEFVQGLGQGLHERGVDLFLSFQADPEAEMAAIRNIVRTRRADGLILGRTAEADPRIDWLLTQGFPFVTFGRTAAEPAPFDWVDTDGAAAFAQAGQMLYALGHRHFGLITIEEGMTFRRHRSEGLARALAGTDARLSVATSPRYDATLRRRAIHQMLTAPDRPTAIVALFDGLALAVVEEAQVLGLRIPQDLSVIGFDNIHAAEHCRPALTTFDSETMAAARELATLLIARMADPKAPPNHHLIVPRLVLRNSHGPAPQPERS